MHFAIQASLFSAEQALLSAEASDTVAPVQPLALALVALALVLFEQQPALAVLVADASVALLVHAEPVLLAEAHSGPAWATDVLKREVKQQSEPQLNCPER
jgi:hypothetical protein